MSSLIDSATAIMTSSARQLELAGTNVANVSTPGFKQVHSTRRLATMPTESFSSALEQTRARLDQGKLISTGRPFDLAVMGSGYLAVRSGDSISYIRNGQFVRSKDGLLVSTQGGVLQRANGGDLVVASQTPEILEDGVVMEDGHATGRAGVFEPASIDQASSVDGAHFDLGSSPQASDTAGLRQGFLEASNVDTGEQMVTMMAALRQTEAGAKLIQTYDELLGKAFATLGQAGR
ncbi:hypothetical protein AQZ52_17550 [Novosphingobium fuchskuhlense]|uniref:Uncharacterized protein n=1 Tax=Novosphingobium fuchskuhlense TaxID=1117702 RepID=A0A117US82_9SPHN|nr:flagellar hook basal-body protein [Novosphingobium fuchskuhlense]KUR69906.1 hypothetical protein AQZ52_17550 [Novosphingobium fuchskuhlense]